MKWSNLETLHFLEVYHIYLDKRETDFTRGAAKSLFDSWWSGSDSINLSVSVWIIFMVFTKHSLEFTFLARNLIWLRDLVPVTFTSTISFLPLLIWWLCKGTNLLLWDWWTKEMGHATQPRTQENETKTQRHSHKDKGWLDGNNVEGQAEHTNADEYSQCPSIQ